VGYSLVEGILVDELWSSLLWLFSVRVRKVVVVVVGVEEEDDLWLLV
jgi:hypothetical protein